MKPNINQAAQSFAQWRANRSQRSHTPAHLKELAIGLVDHYPVSEICERLNINSRSIKSWGEQSQGPRQAFVTLDDKPESSIAPGGGSVELKLLTPNGIECHLSGDLTAPLIASLLRVIHEEVA